MNASHVVRIDRGGRSGKPLLYSVSETLVFVLLAAVLMAAAAVPAALRHPGVAHAQSVASAGSQR
jgi:hypothetical protein